MMDFLIMIVAKEQKRLLIKALNKECNLMNGLILIIK